MIYLDHHAATPLCDEARQAMTEASRRGWANPSSVHAAGRAARGLLEDARARIAASVGAKPADIVLTSGGTEAINLALRGLHLGRRRVVTTSVEHPAVAAAASAPEVHRLDVPRGIPPEPREVAERVDPDTLAAIQWVNHETGTIFPIDEYAEAVRSKGGVLFVDGTQALGKIPVDVEASGADAVAFAAHKMGGPAGAGALWVRRGVDLSPILHGGGQERGRRPGSQDVVSAVGFGAAADAIGRRLGIMRDTSARRDRLEEAARRLGATIQGEGAPRVGTVTHASFGRWRGPVLVAALDVEGLCASSGAACSSGLAEPSPVIAAMYPDDPARAAGALRLSLGPETTDEEVQAAVILLEKVVRRQA